MIVSLISIYFSLAVGYNVVSLMVHAKTGRKLTSNEPEASISMMALVFIVFALPIESASVECVRVGLLSIFTYLIFMNGIVKHLVNFDDHDYFSHTARISGALINIYGVLLLGFYIVQQLINLL
ncbi:MAG: hypothetical protein ACWA5Q_03325 [bacterium]